MFSDKILLKLFSIAYGVWSGSLVLCEKTTNFDEINTKIQFRLNEINILKFCVERFSQTKFSPQFAKYLQSCNQIRVLMYTVLSTK